MKLRFFIALALIPQIFIVNFLKNNPSLVDEYYTNWIYKGIFRINSLIFSNISFPVGELLYLFITFLFIYFIYNLFRFKLTDFLNFFTFISIIYFLFYSLWGLNYFNNSISSKVNLKNQFEFEELDDTIKKIIFNINNEIFKIEKNKIDTFNLKLYIDKNINNNSESNYFKNSIISKFFLYQKVSGHFVPFTSEAIIIKEIPNINYPIVILHEQAHQMGYADEADASFIAFINSIENDSAYIRYSGYFNALINLLNEIIINYPEELDLYKNKLDDRILKDLDISREFWNKYSNNMFDKITNALYDFYLKSNNQESGIKSYSEVSNYIIDFYQNDKLSEIIN